MYLQHKWCSFSMSFQSEEVFITAAIRNGANQPDPKIYLAVLQWVYPISMHILNSPFFSHRPSTFKFCCYSQLYATLSY